MTTAPPPALLVVDDEPSVLALVPQLFRDDFPVLTARNGADALAVLAAHPVGVVIADQRMPGMSGTELLGRVAEQAPDVVRVVLTAFADVDNMLEAINTGRVDQFITKPWDNRDLQLIGRRAMETYRLRHANAHLFAENARLVSELQSANQQLESENRTLRLEVSEHFALGNMVGHSPAMREVFRLLEKAAQSTATVLVSGETGTGKELAAGAIHHHGPRKQRRFVAVNCGALPEPLLESELFGHLKGSFTGALRDRKGLFEEANGGTIFLDEVGEMSPTMQVKLLRVVEDGKLRAVGGVHDVQVDVRIVAATNRDLRADVERGTFRRDLFYRLNVFPVTLPPLRAREGDVRLLAERLLDRCRAAAEKNIRGFTAPALHALEHYAWPGNVRELRNEIERAVALADPGDAIDVPFLSPEVTGQAAAGVSLDGISGEGQLAEQLDRIERHLIQQALRKHADNRTHTAAALGITVRALQKKIVRYGWRSRED